MNSDCIDGNLMNQSALAWASEIRRQTFVMKLLMTIIDSSYLMVNEQVTQLLPTFYS